jgi:peptide/nickel transport system permease protein
VTHDFGLGRPFYAQYGAWLFRVLRGDLGWSPGNSQPVSTAIIERLPATLELACAALVAAIVLGAIVGFARARARAPVLRDVLAAAQLLGRAVPLIVLALSLQFLFIMTALLPAAGMASADAFDLGDRLRHLVAPVLCLAIPFGAWASTIFYDFFRTAGASGPKPVRGIVGPIAMTVALVGPALLSACLLIEQMFAWPGVARLFYGSLSSFDPGVTAGCLLVYCAALVLLNLLTGFARGMPDPASQRGPGSLPTSADGGRRISAPVVVAVVVLLAAAFGAFAADVLAPIGPYFIDQAHWVGYPLAPGVAGHVLGTEENGRDLLARVLIGLRTSIGIAALAALIATTIGFAVAKATTALRPLSGRAALGVVGIRPFAGLPFVLAVVTVLVVRSHAGTHVLTSQVIALIIAAVSWPAIVPAFRTLTSATLGAMIDLMACALLLEVTQSGIGFGVQPPTPSLGNMWANAQSNAVVAPWVPIVSGVVVIAVLFALYALGDELRERGRAASAR